MSGHDNGEGFRPGEDILQHGQDAPAVSWWPSLRRRLPLTRWPSRTAAALLVAAGLVAGLIAGYAAGDHRAAGGPAPGLTPYLPSQAAQLAVGAAPLGQGPACSAQVGSDIQLGFQITNVSASPVTLRKVLAVLPIGGLRALTQSWGACGELPQPDAAITVILSPGASTWFTITFKPLVRCPGPIPVQFNVDDVQRGRPTVVHLPGFEDLGRVPYSGCS